jgi:hypothetical protein
VIWLLSIPEASGSPGFLTDVAVLCLPVSVAVAVLRYRLWDLDRLVSRGVTNLLLTGLLVLPYLLILPAATRLAGGVGNLAVAAATLAAAAGTAPPRPGCRAWWTAASTDAATMPPAPWRRSRARLREQVDLDALSTELLAVVEQTVAPTTASLWLRPPASPRLPR